MILLSADAMSPLEGGMILLVAVIAIVFTVLIIRWVFKVGKTEAYQRSSLALLKEIALKHGVEEEKVNNAMSYFRKEEED